MIYPRVIKHGEARQHGNPLTKWRFTAGKIIYEILQMLIFHCHV